MVRATPLCGATEPGDRDRALLDKLASVQFDALDLMQRLGGQIALAAVRAANDRNTLNQEAVRVSRRIRAPFLPQTSHTMLTEPHLPEGRRSG